MIIYKAENKINGKVYIGQTTEDFKKRIQRHKQSALKDNNIYFYNAIKKHGWNNFDWSIICETDSFSKLNVLEKFYIAAYKKMTDVYNMTDGGGGRTGYQLTKETKFKISTSAKGRIAPNKNIPHTEATKNKIRIKAIGRIITDETKAKMSEARKKYIVPESTCIKISESRKKQLPPMQGKKHTLETKRKMSEAAFKRWNNEN
jgi:group I intron endonuclease